MWKVLAAGLGRFSNVKRLLLALALGFLAVAVIANSVLIVNRQEALGRVSSDGAGRMGEEEPFPVVTASDPAHFAKGVEDSAGRERAPRRHNAAEVHVVLERNCDDIIGDARQSGLR